MREGRFNALLEECNTCSPRVVQGVQYHPPRSHCTRPRRGMLSTQMQLLVRYVVLAYFSVLYV